MVCQSVLLNLAADASVLVGTAALLVYKDFYAAGAEVQSDAAAVGRAAAELADEAAARDYAFFCLSCWYAGFTICATMLLAEWSLERQLERRAGREADRRGRGLGHAPQEANSVHHV